MSTERRVVLTAGTVELRRRLDPAGWVVFEQLLLESTSNGDTCDASVSVRSLAAQLGLSKDTVARALTRLRRAGLIDASQSRTATGAFTTGQYRLHVPDSITVTDDTPSPTPAPSQVRSRSNVVRSSRSTSQLALAIDP
jgi:DNA-binding transcriptional MocR family regulator